MTQLYQWPFLQIPAAAAWLSNGNCAIRRAAERASGWRGSTSKTGESKGQFFPETELTAIHVHVDDIQMSPTHQPQGSLCWILIAIPFANAKWTGLGINALSQSHCFPPFSLLCNQHSIFFPWFFQLFPVMSLWICLGSLVQRLGFSYNLCERVMIPGNDMLNHLAITVSNTSANLSCRWKHRIPWPCPQREQRRGNRNLEAIHELWVCILCCLCLCSPKKVSLKHTYLCRFICYIATCLHLPSAITKRFSIFSSTGI